jgi:hypothetical protein
VTWSREHRLFRVLCFEHALLSWELDPQIPLSMMEVDPMS